MDSHWIHTVYWPVVSKAGKPSLANISAPGAQYSGVYFIPDYAMPQHLPITGFDEPYKNDKGITTIRRLAGSPYKRLKAKYDQYFGSPNGYPPF